MNVWPGLCDLDTVGTFTYGIVCNKPPGAILRIGEFSKVTPCCNNILVASGSPDLSFGNLSVPDSRPQWHKSPRVQSGPVGARLFFITNHTYSVRWDTPQVLVKLPASLSIRPIPS